jgi:hypothetical protein
MPAVYNMASSMMSELAYANSNNNGPNKVTSVRGRSCPRYFADARIACRYFSRTLSMSSDQASGHAELIATTR